MVVPKRRLEEDYVWSAFDGISAPFALLIGALHTLDDTSSGYSCSKNTTALRTEFRLATNFFADLDDLEGFTAIHEALSHLDEVGLNCYYAFDQDLNAAYWLKIFGFWYEIPLNLLYNAGAMWVDAVNYMFYNPETVPGGDWGFFFFYLIGDFVFRFFVRDETPNR